MTRNHLLANECLATPFRGKLVNQKKQATNTKDFVQIHFIRTLMTNPFRRTNLSFDHMVTTTLPAFHLFFDWGLIVHHTSLPTSHQTLGECTCGRWLKIYTLPETNIAPASLPNRKLVFQPSIFGFYITEEAWDAVRAEQTSWEVLGSEQHFPNACNY